LLDSLLQEIFIAMDIRNFFGSKGATKASGPKANSKPKEEEKKKKRAQVLSDSDSEEEVAKKVQGFC